MNQASDEWQNSYSHEPNLVTPPGAGDFRLAVDGVTTTIDLAQLTAMAYTKVTGCYIVSTGHGRSGPFTFGGVSVRDFLVAFAPDLQRPITIDFISADGYRARLDAARIESTPPPLLAYVVNDTLMHREQGLVRLIVPNEYDDALLQVKWLAYVELIAAA